MDMRNNMMFAKFVRDDPQSSQPMRNDPFLSHSGQTLDQDEVQYDAMKGGQSSYLASSSLSDEIQEVQMEDVADFNKASRDSSSLNCQHVQQTSQNSPYFLNRDVTNVIMQPNYTSQTPLTAWGQGASIQFVQTGCESNQLNINMQSNAPTAAANPFHGVHGVPMGKSDRTHSNSATIISNMGNLNQENVNNSDQVNHANYFNGCHQYYSNGYTGNGTDGKHLSVKNNIFRNVPTQNPYGTGTVQYGIQQHFGMKQPGDNTMSQFSSFISDSSYSQDSCHRQPFRSSDVKRDSKERSNFEERRHFGQSSETQSDYTEHRATPWNKSKRLVKRVSNIRDMWSKEEMIIDKQVQHSSLVFNMPPDNDESSDEDLYVAVKRLNRPDPSRDDFYIDWAEMSDDETYPIPTTDRSEFVPMMRNLTAIEEIENPSRDLKYQSIKRRHEGDQDLCEDNVSRKKRSARESDHLNSYLSGMARAFDTPDSLILPNKHARRRRSGKLHKDERGETRMLDYSFSVERLVTRKAKVSVDNSRQCEKRTESSLQVLGHPNERTHDEMEFVKNKNACLIPQVRGVIGKICRVETRINSKVSRNHGDISTHGQTELINISPIQGQQQIKESCRRHVYGSEIPHIYSGLSEGNRSEDKSSCLTNKPNQQVFCFDKGLNPTTKSTKTRRNRPNPQRRRKALEKALEGQEHPVSRNGILPHPNNQVGAKALIACTDKTNDADIPYSVRAIRPNTRIGYSKGNENKSLNSSVGKKTTERYEGYIQSVNGAFPDTKCLICGTVTTNPIRHMDFHLPRILHEDMLHAEFLNKSVSDCIVNILVYLKQMIIDKKKSFLQLRRFIDDMQLIDPYFKDKSVSNHYSKVMRRLCRFQGWEIPNVFTIVPLNSCASLIHWHVLEVCLASVNRKQRKDFLSYCYHETFHLLSKNNDGRDGSHQNKGQKENVLHKDKDCVNNEVNDTLVKQVNDHTKAQSISMKQKKTEYVTNINTLDKIAKESAEKKKKTHKDSNDINTKNISNKSTIMNVDKSIPTVEKNKKDSVSPTKKNSKYVETTEKSTQGTINKCSSEKSALSTSEDAQMNSGKKKNSQLSNVPIIMEMEIPNESETPTEIIEKDKHIKLTNVPLVVDMETCSGATKAAPEITINGLEKGSDNSPIKHAGGRHSPVMNTPECAHVTTHSISPITSTVNIPKYAHVNCTEIMMTCESNMSGKSAKVSKDEFNENTRPGLHQTPVVDIKCDLQSAITKSSDEDAKAKLHKSHVDTESSTCVDKTKEAMNEIQQISYTGTSKLGINIEIGDALLSTNSMEDMGDNTQLVPGSGGMNTEMDVLEVFSITMDPSLNQSSPSVSYSLSEPKCSKLTRHQDKTRLVISGTEKDVDQVVDDSETSVPITIESDANTTNKDHHGGKDKATNSSSTKCVVNIEVGDVGPLGDTKIEHYKAITIPVAELIVLEERRSSNSNETLNHRSLTAPAMKEGTDLVTANSSFGKQTESEDNKELLNEPFTVRYSDPSSYPSSLSADMTYAIGVNPIHAQALTEERFEQFERLLQHKSTRALGEVGLDWTTPENTWSCQETVFKQVLEFCTARKAVFLTLKGQQGDSCLYKKAFNIMQDFCGSNQSILLDEFCGGEDVVKSWLGKFRNCYFGFSKNILVFTRKDLLVLKMIPLDRIVLEYGCQNGFSKENDIQTSDDVKISICAELSKVARIVANTLGIGVKEVVKISNENRCRLLHI